MTRLRSILSKCLAWLILPHTLATLCSWTVAIVATRWKLLASTRDQATALLVSLLTTVLAAHTVIERKKNATRKRK